MTADAAELMHARSRADVREIIHHDVAAERRHVAENRVVADVTVVGDMHVRHEHVPIADRRHPAAAARAAMDGDELAEDIAAPDDQTRFLAFELEILRRETDRGEWKNLRAVADVGPAVDNRRGAYDAIGAETDVRADHRQRADLRPGA